MRANIVRSSAFYSRGIKLGRLDAEYVNPDILSRERLLQELHGALPLRQDLDLNIGVYTRPKDQTDSQLAYIAIDNIDSADGFIFHQSLPECDLPSRAKYRLESFDLVISNVRPERGGVGLVLPSQSGAIASSGTTVLRIKDKELRNVVFAFLRSELARMQLVRRSRGSMYPAITKDDVPEIFVPSLSPKLRQAINEQVENSVAFRDKFFDLVRHQAETVEEYLRDALGPPPPDSVLDVTDELSVRVASKEEFFSSGAARFDAEFHRKEYVDFETRLRASPGIIRLGDCYTAFAGGNPGRGSETVYRLRQAQLSGFGLAYSACEELEDSKGVNRLSLHQDDVLIGCTAHEPHYVGNRVDLVDDLPADVQGSIMPVPDVMLIRSRGQEGVPPPAFLASFLRTKWGRRQFQRLNRGVRGGHVYGQDVERFIYVPTPSPEWLSAFNDRQGQIRAARRGSIRDMSLAIQLVESISLT